MVRSRWAVLSILNLLLCMASFAVLSGSAHFHPPPWLRLLFVAAITGLGFPLITLSPILKSTPEEMILLMLLNAVIWGTFWDWLLRKFVDPPRDSGVE